MLRLSELSLPLDHSPEELREAIVTRLTINNNDLIEYHVFKRSYDARKKNSTILFVYVIDLQLRNEAAVLKRFKDDRNVAPSPDTNYHFVAHAPALLDERPIVI